MSGQQQPLGQNNDTIKFYEVDLENAEETNQLIRPKPIAINTQQRIKEEENNPFNTSRSTPRKEREALMKRMKKSSDGKRRGCCRTSPFFKLFLEQFDATILLLPYLFMKIGYMTATIQLIAFSLLSAFCAKLMVESARLQVGNLHMHNREDFESLVSSNRVTQNWLVGITCSIYPFLLIAGTAVSIIMVSSLIDEIINVFVEGEPGLTSSQQYFVNLLPASDKDMKPIPDTELIQISRGFAFCLVLALLYSATVGPRKLYYGSILKVFALISLFVGISLELPNSFWSMVKNRQFSAIEFPQGEEITILQTIFYSGFIAFSVSSFPIVVTEVASEIKTAHLPLYRSTLFAVLIKFTFGMLGGSLILASNSESMPKFALIGAGVYALFHLLPSIIQIQAKVQMIIFYRGSCDAAVSVIFSAVLPWVFSSLVHHYDTVMTITCLLGSTFAMFASYVNTIWFYCSSVGEACFYESNFKLSVKQMYAGDKLSKKETCILPKTYKDLGGSCHNSVSRFSNSDSRPTAFTENSGQNSLVVRFSTGQPQSTNIPGAIKCKQYPTTQFLRQSEMKQHRSDCCSDLTDAASAGQFSAVDAPTVDSDFSEAFSIQSDDDNDCAPLESEVFIKTYNQQGHYATKQSLETVLGPTTKSCLSTSGSLVVLQVAAAVLVIMATIMYYSWILIGSESAKTQVSLFAYEETQRSHGMVVELAQTASRVRYGFAQVFAHHNRL